jgi:hypothetical protein
VQNVGAFDNPLIPVPWTHRPSGVHQGHKGLHSAEYVTVELRRRYKMSHRTGLEGHWHARCLSSYQQGGTSPASEGSKLADTQEDCGCLERLYSTGSGASNTDNSNDDDTPPQIKQATKPLSHNRGFFLEVFVRLQVFVGS